MPTGTTGTFQYQEGGGKFPPYQEDYFQRIVNVQWLQGATGARSEPIWVPASADVFNRVELALQGTINIPVAFAMGAVSATTTFPGAEGPFPLVYYNTAVGIPGFTPADNMTLSRPVGNIFVRWAANVEPNGPPAPNGYDWIFQVGIVQSSSSAAVLLDGLTNISLTITIGGPMGPSAPPPGPYTPTASLSSITLGAGPDVGFVANGTTGVTTTTANFVIDWTNSTQATNQSSVTLITT